MDKIADVIKVINVGSVVAYFLLNTSRIFQAIELSKECLSLLDKTALEKEHRFVKLFYIVLCHIMSNGYRLINDHASALKCCRNLLEIRCRCGERTEEGEVTFEMATLYENQSNYKEAKQLYEKALSIMTETGDTRGEGECYNSLGTLFLSLGEYAEAKKYHTKALANKKIGDRKGEAASYGNLGSVFQAFGEYGKAEQYLQKALTIAKETGGRQEEASCYGNLGTVF